MTLQDFIGDINHCCAAKIYIPRIDYEIVVSAINFDHLVEVINEIKHFNKGCSVEDISYYDQDIQK